MSVPPASPDPIRTEMEQEVLSSLNRGDRKRRTEVDALDIVKELIDREKMLK